MILPILALVVLWLLSKVITYTFFVWIFIIGLLFTVAAIIAAIF
jgi:hypothetical protein